MVDQPQHDGPVTDDVPVGGTTKPAASVARGTAGSNGANHDDDLPRALPAAAAITAVGGLATAALALIGADDVASLTRGAPLATFAGATLLVAAVLVSAGAALITGALAKRIVLGVAYLLLLLGLTGYLFAGVKVNEDPPAPSISMTNDAATDATKVDVSATRLAFDERLYVAARYASDPATYFNRAVIGPDKGGLASSTFSVGPQSGAEHRLQVVARIFKRDEQPKDETCTEAAADRTCAEAGATLREGLPAVSARLDGMTLHVTVTGRARTPGLAGVRITRRAQELRAARPRIDQRPYRTTIRLARHHGTGTDVVCVAASFDEGTPPCNGSSRNSSFVRLYPRFHVRR
jgi:hypothetical protein